MSFAILKFANTIQLFQLISLTYCFSYNPMRKLNTGCQLQKNGRFLNKSCFLEKKNELSEYFLGMFTFFIFEILSIKFGVLTL